MDSEVQDCRRVSPGSERGKEMSRVSISYWFHVKVKNKTLYLNVTGPKPMCFCQRVGVRPYEFSWDGVWPN